MLLRATTALICLPGIVGYALPVAMGLGGGQPAQHRLLCGLLVGSGTLLLLTCVREFYLNGRGTLAPWSPPRHLVTTGPYRYSRNPMYVGVLGILIGWAFLWASLVLSFYAIAVLVGFVLRVRFHEEPWAARTFGAEWEAYRQRVPRWFIVRF